MNNAMMDPGRGPSDLELYPVTMQYCMKAEKRTREKGVWSDLKKKKLKTGKNVHTNCLDLIRLAFSNIFFSPIAAFPDSLTAKISVSALSIG